MIVTRGPATQNHLRVFIKALKRGSPILYVANKTGGLLAAKTVDEYRLYRRLADTRTGVKPNQRGYSGVFFAKHCRAGSCTMTGVILASPSGHFGQRARHQGSPRYARRFRVLDACARFPSCPPWPARGGLGRLRACNRAMKWGCRGRGRAATLKPLTTEAMARAGARSLGCGQRPALWSIMPFTHQVKRPVDPSAFPLRASVPP